jgi:tetratricopeptide (TPR) repeat protein
MGSRPASSSAANKPTPAPASAQQKIDEITALKKSVGELYQAGKFAEAIPLAQRFWELSEQALGPEHPDTAISLNNLAALYGVTGQYAQAEPLHQRALRIKEKALGPEHPAVAGILTNLAFLATDRQRYPSAVGFFQKSLLIEDRYIRNVFAFTTEAQKLRFMRSISGSYLMSL